MATINLSELRSAYFKWLERGGKQDFSRWLRSERPDITRGVNAIELRFQCREMVRTMSGRKESTGLSEATLLRYSVELARYHLARPKPRTSYPELFDQVQVQCPTERSLRRFLGLQGNAKR